MIFSILWGVFLLGVLLAVPIASFIDRRNRPPMPMTDEPVDEEMPFDESLAGDADDDVPEVLTADSNDPFGNDNDFAAFDEKFK